MTDPMQITSEARPYHPGMSPTWYDSAAHRAIMSGKVARRISPGQWVVSSVTVPGLLYLTTEHDCTCPGHRAYGRCCCRALVCLETWLAKQGSATDDRPAA